MSAEIPAPFAVEVAVPVESIHQLRDVLVLRGTEIAHESAVVPTATSPSSA